MAKQANAKSWGLYQHPDGSKRSYPASGLIAAALLNGLAPFASAGALNIQASAAVPDLTDRLAISTQLNSGFTMPLGIPNFPWDFRETIPTVPASWTSNTAGFYYVKQGGSNANQGFPSSPRGSIPDLSTIPDGSVVVIDNTANLTGTDITINPIGSSGAKIWLVGSQQVGLGSGATQAQIRYTGDFNIAAGSQWFVIDGIDFLNNTNAQQGWAANRCTNYVVRNCTIRANGADRSANSSNYVGGTNTSTRSQYGMFYNNVVRDFGLWTHVGGDIDCHGIQVGQWVDDHWFINNQFFHNQGDGIQVTGDGSPSNNTPSVVRRLYVGGNTFYENLQTGFWIKTGTDIIFSQNIVYNQTDGGGSAPVGCGGQYDFSSVWYIFNRIYDCGNGIRFASTNNGIGDGKIRIIGNVITNSNGVGGTIQTNSPFSDGCAISFWQGTDVRVCFNTIWQFAGHGIGSTPGAANGAIVENNIVAGRSNGSCFDLFWETFTTQPKVRNNSFPASPRFSMDGSNTTSVSAFQSASSANRSNNLSGSVSFVNAVTGASGNFDTQAGDATRNAGLLTTDVFAEFLTAYSLDIKVDFAGTTRPQSTLYDMGAYEH